MVSTAHAPQRPATLSPDAASAKVAPSPCRRLRALGVVAMLVAIGACGERPAGAAVAAGASQPVAADARVGVAVDSVNYRHERAMKYTLFDLSTSPPKAVGGEIVPPLAEGGSKGCCLALPVTWRPGLKVRVNWRESDYEQIYPEQYERDLEVPRYDKPADLFVVFTAPHEVEVVVSPAEPGHPQWAGSIKQTPWDYCVEHQGRKACKAALPKMFDVESAKGFCKWVTEEKRPGAEDTCGSAMFDCMNDYEDESFCRNLLWGERKR